jgi:hypothetical protein
LLCSSNFIVVLPVLRALITASSDLQLAHLLLDLAAKVGQLLAVQQHNHAQPVHNRCCMHNCQSVTVDSRHQLVMEEEHCYNIDCCLAQAADVEG